MIPAISVILPVFNASAHLAEAVSSILSQTFRDFELLAIDDASTDGSMDVLRSFNDSRVKMVRNETNLGVAPTLNRGLDMATGEFIARMDSDDISRPRRLERQVAFMRERPGTVACGAEARLFGQGAAGRMRRPSGPACVKAALCLDNPIVHPTAILRRDAVERHRLRYDPAFGRSEDYDLWRRFAGVGDIDNIPDVLLDYRVHGASVTSVASTDMENQTLQILLGELEKVGLNPNREELLFHRKVGHGVRLESLQELDRAETWLRKLADETARTGCHSNEGMAAAIGFHWFNLCANCGNLGVRVWRKWRSSSCSRGYEPSAIEKGRFLLGVVRNLAVSGPGSRSP